EPERLAAEVIHPSSLDKDALRVVSRLQERGFEAYFVGGCVRDLLIGRRPKDYDVATSARPGQVKRLFKNGRIIGRRFRLVHVTFGHKIIETATFRQAPKAQGTGDLLITEDNEYGTANEDAQRRDFTVNGLFLEPREHEVIDYVEGLQDLENRVLRTIGKPKLRLLEDPVRIMRAVKFATRLDFRIENQTWDAMCSVAPELERSAPPRVFEEVLRLMRSGTAMGAFKMLRACGALRSILPAQDIHLGVRRGGPEEDHLRAELFWRLLEALDIEVHQGYEPTVAVVIAVLFNDLVEREVDPQTRTRRGEPGDRMSVCRAVMDPLFEATRLNRREFGRAQRLIASQSRFQALTNPSFSPLLFARQEDFPEALDLFGLREKARGVGWDIFEAWQEIEKRAQVASEDELEMERRRVRRRPRRGRRRRRK
ncbi:MAG: polynucleotide adenylyltransferase PcnB, partial [Planctomycetota bacterium]|nr:polynucleotide adenylyltransferase PcnB [Planctomycetota bacterium]